MAVDTESTKRMSSKLIQDRSAVLGAANTYAEVLFAALGALVARSRKDRVAKVEGDESYMQVYLADTPCDYRGVMRLCGYTVETGVQDTMDKAYEELRSKWHEKYNAIVHEMQVSAVAHALEKKREAAKAEEQEPKQQQKQLDVCMFDAMCKIHGMIRDMMRQPDEKDCERTIACNLIEFSLKVRYSEGMWRAEFQYWDHEDKLSDKDRVCLLTRVWWGICDVMGWMYE